MSRMPLVSTIAAKATRAFARVDVHRSVAPILDAWAELEANAPCSIYQTRAWVLPWLETLGRASQIEPLFLLAWGHDDRPVGLLCLGVARKGPVRVASWLGGKDSNLNLPLLRTGSRWSRDDAHALLAAARKPTEGDAPDVFHLVNQPFAWSGGHNPFALLHHQASPSAAYGTFLPRDAEDLFRSKLSKETRKKLRQKEKKLALLGPVTHRIAIDLDDQAAMTAAFLGMKVDRFNALGIRSAFGTPAMRAFIEQASTPQGSGIELHALDVGGRIVAVYGGAAVGGHWSGMFNAFDMDEEIARTSPGDLLLMKVVAKACADGLTHFDLGIGEARYKAALCNERIDLFDTFIPMTTKGRIAALALSLTQRVKRTIKNDARLFALAKRLRAFKGLSPSTDQATS